MFQILATTKVYKGLNVTAQAKLADFLADHIPLQNFMTYAEEEYYRAQGMNSSSMNRVLPISSNASPQSSQPVTNANQVVMQKNEVEKLSKKLEDLTRQLEKMSSKKQKKNEKYCSFCRVTDHNLSDCPLDPPKGVCFDCFQPNLRRGHNGCPGPIDRNRIN